MIPLSPFGEAIEGSFAEDIVKVVEAFGGEVTERLCVRVLSKSLCQSLQDCLHRANGLRWGEQVDIRDEDAVAVFDLDVGLRWAVLLVVVFVEFEEAGEVALVVDLLDQDGEAARVAGAV